MPTNAIERELKMWNLWHGCHKVSEGCMHCYVYRGEGYEHVTICCTIENQARADERLPIYQVAPIKYKILICEPLLGPIDLRPYNIGSWVEQVVVGGESGLQARPCQLEWILALRTLCVGIGVSFWFKQTGANFIKNGKQYTIKRQFQHAQARKSGLNAT